MPDSNRYYVHEMAIENGTTSMFKTGTSVIGTHSDRSYPSIRTLLQQLIDVKSEKDADNTENVGISMQPQHPALIIIYLLRYPLPLPVIEI